jgi:hypothetical protein
MYLCPTFLKAFASQTLPIWVDSVENSGSRCCSQFSVAPAFVGASTIQFSAMIESLFRRNRLELLVGTFSTESVRSGGQAPSATSPFIRNKQTLVVVLAH